MERKKHKSQLTIQVETGKMDLASRDLRDILVYIFRWEPVILGIMLADAARHRRRVKAYINSVKLLELAILPPNFFPKDLIDDCFEAIIESLPRGDLTFILDFMAGYLAENQPIPTWQEVAKPLKNTNDKAAE
ncbi:TPA: hypothetical protein EYP27_06010 [Candidatus Bathyarchaeota archaeon]|nr:hypothetical protein [Candidatus Bathyarchaeota archaeon]